MLCLFMQPEMEWSDNFENKVPRLTLQHLGLCSALSLSVTLHVMLSFRSCREFLVVDVLC